MSGTRETTVFLLALGLVLYSIVEELTVAEARRDHGTPTPTPHAPNPAVPCNGAPDGFGGFQNQGTCPTVVTTTRTS